MGRAKSRRLTAVPGPTEHGRGTDRMAVCIGRCTARGERPAKVVLMVHGYKGFKEWGNGKEWLSNGRARDGMCGAWTFPTMAVFPFGRCIDTDAWSANRSISR